MNIVKDMKREEKGSARIRRREKREKREGRSAPHAKTEERHPKMVEVDTSMTHHYHIQVGHFYLVCSHLLVISIF